MVSAADSRAPANTGRGRSAGDSLQVGWTTGWSGCAIEADLYRGLAPAVAASGGGAADTALGRPHRLTH